MLKLELYDYDVNFCQSIFLTSSRKNINICCLDYLDSNFCLRTFEIYNWLTAYLLGWTLTNIIQGPGIQKTFIFDAALKVLSYSHKYSITVLFCCFFLVREIKFNSSYWSFFLSSWLQLPMLRKVSLDVCDASEGDFDIPDVSYRMTIPVVYTLTNQLKWRTSLVHI